MADINLKGMGIALVTPFKEDESVDYEALSRLVDHLLQNGADYLVVLGTTAETPTLTEDEKKKILELVITKVRHRIPIVLGLGGNCTKNVVDKLKTDNFDDIDAILSVVPYYNKPSQEGIYQHYKAIASATKLPVILYNVPGRTGVNMTAETTLRLAREFKNIVAVKEASGNISQIEHIIQNAPSGFEVLSGDDAITFELLTLGAQGVISVLGNAYPSDFAEMVHAGIQGNTSRSLEIHRQFSDLYRLLSVDGNPSGIKCLLSVQGKINNLLRLPLTPVTRNTQKSIEEFNRTFS